MKRLIGIIVKALAWFSGGAVVFFISLYLMTSGDYLVASTVSGDPSLPRLMVNNRALHDETFGDPASPVIIVVHGGPGWGYGDLFPLKELADQYFVVFYDQRGSGLFQSAWTKGTHP